MIARDTSSRAGAERLKSAIERYWADRGHLVTCYVVEVAFDPAMRATSYGVRSNLRNGLPD